jgi:hypothetical protein
MRERVEFEPNRMARMTDRSRGRISGHATGGVGTGGERIQGDDALLAFPEKRDGLGFIPSQQRAIFALRPFLELGIEIR